MAKTQGMKKLEEVKCTANCEWPLLVVIGSSLVLRTQRDCPGWGYSLGRLLSKGLERPDWRRDPPL